MFFLQKGKDKTKGRETKQQTLQSALDRATPAAV